MIDESGMRDRRGVSASDLHTNLFLERKNEQKNPLSFSIRINYNIISNCFDMNYHLFFFSGLDFD